MDSHSTFFEIFSKIWESKSLIFEYFFFKYGGPNLGFLKYSENMKSKSLCLYTNLRLGPDYGFGNGIFTRSTSFWKKHNYKGDADTQDIVST